MYPSISISRRGAAPARPAWVVPWPSFKLLAVAAALAGPAIATAQPSGATVIHGEASLGNQGNQLTVTTRNKAGTRHSAIDWQSFSVPQGSITRFNQPDAYSTSINRVTGNDPSQILGTLSSNGTLVLVNPAGIAVGHGAAVDTAGFTASTLRMSDADALAGRMRFDGGLPGAVLGVDGRVTAQVGDVVLIASHVAVGKTAFVHAPDGAVVLAAGQKVELTGRGLEGIRMEVVAPTDSAVNLGALQGDAVGVFAANLRHSGLIRAEGAEQDGNKLRLVASRSIQNDGVTSVGRAAPPLARNVGEDQKEKQEQEKKEKEENEEREKKEKEEKEKGNGNSAGNANNGNSNAGGNGNRDDDNANSGRGQSQSPAGDSAASPPPAGATTPPPSAGGTAEPTPQVIVGENQAPPAPPPAQAPAADPPATDNAPAPAGQAPAPVADAPALSPSTIAKNVNAPVSAVIAAKQEQEQQVIIFSADAGAEPLIALSPAKSRKKKDLAEAANAAEQCEP